MAFKLPFITKRAVVNKVTDLPQFRYEDLEENGTIGRGSFGVVEMSRDVSRCREMTLLLLFR